MLQIKNLVEKVKILVKEEKFEEALEVLEKELKKQPSSNEIKNLFVEILFSYGGYLNDELVFQHEKAADCFKRIIELEPDNYRAHYNLGISYQYLGEMNLALKECNEAIRLKPDYKHCYYNIGVIYETTGRPKKALKYFDKALKIDPKFTYALQAKTMLTQELNAINENQPKSGKDDESDDGKE